MRFKHVFIYSSFCILYSSLSNAQEHLAPLRSNPVLVKYVKEAARTHAPAWRLISDSIMAKLPFIDDFSKPGPYPNDSLWMDNAAFINNTYPICPHTIGVATLDGVNSKGQPYDPTCPPGNSESADSLTSRPINLTLNHLNPGDSLWLSFYWQAGGKGSPPQTNDTLLLQFRTNKIPWTTVWYHLGYTPAANDTNFHLVMIPIKAAQYFDPNFQFRFKNYACTSANVDQWNIDEVYLNEFRTYTDTAQSDVSFVYNTPSLLANYQYMPWEQFTAKDLRDSMFTFERNNSANLSGINMSYNYTINTPTPSTYSGGHHNIYPFFSNGYHNYVPQTHIPIKSNFNYTPLTGPANITMTQILTPSDFIPQNDTLKFGQIFSDYYAYDDGTAEAAYFINGTTPIYLAYQFTLNNPDTLRGLELYFDYTFVNPTGYAFHLALWDNSGPQGSPGKLLFEDPYVHGPEFVDSANGRLHDSLNGFTFYPYHFVHRDTVVRGTFYVGWVQTYGDSLNIGYDLNTDHHNQIYYNNGSFPAYYSTGWNPGTYPGSMMMRPVFGKANSHGPVLGVSDIEKKNETLTVYPNPARDRVTLSASMPRNTILKIYAADGREYLNNTNFSGNSINTSLLPAGFYIIELTPPDGKTSYQKLLIQK